MINKKTIAIKQDEKGMLTKGISTMTPAEVTQLRLAMEKILASRGLPGILSQIGRVHEVPFTDGRKTLSVILTYEGVRSLGIDLNTVFKGCRGKEIFDERTDVKNGVLVNLDLYQQVALLRAIIKKKPELQDVLGLYNLRGSRKVYEVLTRAGIPGQLNIWWMWTGEKYIPGQNNEGDYQEEGIATLPNLSTLKGNRFADRNIVLGSWDDSDPDCHGSHGVVIFGAQR